MVILILTDFSEAATNAAIYATALSQQIEIEKFVVYHSIETGHMATELPLPSEPERKHLYEISHQRLNDLKIKLQSLLPEGTPVEVLTDERPLEVSAQAVALESNADLLILGTTHRSGIEKMIYESTASLLSTTCTKPLLIIPANTRYETIQNIVFATDLHQVSSQLPVHGIQKFKKLLHARLFVLNIFKEESGEPDKIMIEYFTRFALFVLPQEVFNSFQQRHITIDDNR